MCFKKAEREKKKINRNGAYSYKFYEKKAKIDFKIENEEYTELSSLGFVVESYKNSCLALLEKMEKYDFANDVSNSKYLTTFYLPAMFCFRHYVEVKIKYLYIWYYGEPLQLLNDKSHKLKKLINAFRKAGNNKFAIFDEIIQYIEKYEHFTSSGKKDPSYFRYLADKEYNSEQELSIPFDEIAKIKRYINELEFRVEEIRQNDWFLEILNRKEEKNNE